MIKKSRYESGWYFFSFVYNDVISSKIDPKQSPRASHYRSKANLTHLFHLFKLLNRRSSKFDIKWRYYNYNCHFSCTYNLYWPHICCTVRLNSFSARTCFFDWRYKTPQQVLTLLQIRIQVSRSQLTEKNWKWTSLWRLPHVFVPWLFWQVSSYIICTLYKYYWSIFSKT